MEIKTEVKVRDHEFTILTVWVDDEAFTVRYFDSSKAEKDKKRFDDFGKGKRGFQSVLLGISNYDTWEHLFDYVYENYETNECKINSFNKKVGILKFK